MCLDYNRVTGKLRALVLDDEEYKQETRNIYAKQRLEELQEIDSLAALATSGEEEEEYDPRRKGKKKKTASAEKDMLTMRFKAAQMKRELINALNTTAGTSERDAVNLWVVNVSREEIVKSIKAELYDGSADETLDALIRPKEEAPEGTSGKVRYSGKTRGPADEDMFETLPDGGIVEK
jgi:hypothetical protein